MVCILKTAHVVKRIEWDYRVPGMADSEGKVMIVDIASLSEQDSDEAVEIITNKKKRTSSKSNGNLSNSESR